MDQENQQNPAVEDEQSTSAEDPAPAEATPAAADAGAEADANPAAESGNKAAETENSQAGTVNDVNQKIAGLMGKYGGAPGKWVGRAYGQASETVNEGLKVMNDQKGSYDNKTVTDDQGNQVPQRRTVTSEANDAALQTQLSAGQKVADVTGSETAGKVAGVAAGTGRLLYESAKDTGTALYQGAKSRASGAWNKLKSMAGVGNP